MEHYFMLGNWTDQGVRNLRESPKRTDAAKDLASKLGGKLDVFMTMGQYDFIAVVEMPSDEAVAQLVLQLGGQGNVRTTTLKAWPMSEATKIISKLQ